MNKLNLKFRGGKLKDLLIQIDNDPIKFKQNKFGNFEYNYETEKDVVNIKIQRVLELQSKFWFLWQMLFFVISLFGIFDRRLDKRCVIIDAEYNVNVNENSQIEFMLDYTKPESVLKVQSNAEIEQVKNVSYVDKNLKKRLKILRLTKIFTAIGVVILVGVLVIVLVL